MAVNGGWGQGLLGRWLGVRLLIFGLISAITTTGCSFLWVREPPTQLNAGPSSRTLLPSCGDSYTAPAMDTAAVLFFALPTIGLASMSKEEFIKGESSSSGLAGDRHPNTTRFVAVGVFAAMALTGLVSAIYGYHYVANCRTVPMPTIQGITFKAGTHVGFRNDGSISEATPSDDTTIGGTTYKAETEVKFRASGEVQSGFLAADATIGEATYKAGTKVKFYENGGVESGSLAVQATIQGTAFKAGTEVKFRASGEVQSGFLAADATIQGTAFKAGTEVWFHVDGGIGFVTLAVNSNIDGITYEAGTKVEFYRSGKVESGTLAADTALPTLEISRVGIVLGPSVGDIAYSPEETTEEIITYRAGTTVKFDAKGRVVGAGRR
jgi:hypothetical protein